eukprot:gene6778-4889_t
MDVSPPPLYMFATHKSIYTTSVIPSASPTAQPTPLDVSCDDKSSHRMGNAHQEAKVAAVAVERPMNLL